jgi:membrane protease YdiL (CAAX protease family)
VLPIFSTNLKINVLITAILFGMTHFDNWLHVVSAFLGGLLYGYAYVLGTAKMTFPFVAVFVIHSLSNALLFVLYRLI